MASFFQAAKDKIFKKAAAERKAKATEELRVLNDVTQLKKSLESLGNPPSGDAAFDYGVDFFNIIASFQDKHPNGIGSTNDNKDVEVINKHIENAGRNQYGWVRSDRGERVSLDNLYLGNVYGIWTHTARKFKTFDSDTKNTIITKQLLPFISSHRQPLIDRLTKVINAESQSKIMVGGRSGR